MWKSAKLKCGQMQSRIMKRLDIFNADEDGFFF